MIRTFVALRRVDPGFARSAEVQTFRVSVPGALIRDPRHVAQLHAQIVERLQNVPGVVSVGLSSSITMDGDRNGHPTIVEHVPVRGGERPPHRRFKSIGPGYFETMGNRVVAGRSLTWADVHQARPVVVISENLARAYWLDPSEALGKRLTNSPGLPWREIVGVVGNVHDEGPNQPPTAIVYWPMLIEQFGDGPLSVSRTMAYAVRSSRVRHTRLPARAAASDLGRRRQSAARQREGPGRDPALGAQAVDVRRMVLGQGMMLTGVGISIGLIGALGVTRVMRALLYQTSPTDLLTFVAVIPVLAGAALLACWIPARRAVRADPIIALRSE